MTNNVACALFLAIALAWAPGPPAHAELGAPLDRASVLGAQTFEETFNQERLSPSRWSFNFWYGDQNGPSSRVYGGDALQIFSTARYNGVDPFKVSRNALTILARPNANMGDPRNDRRPYTSGLLTTFKSFNQRYGYFEAKLRGDMVTGLWPAFWVLGQKIPTDKDMEIDVFEGLGSTPGTAFQSTHYVVQPIAAEAQRRDDHTYQTTGVNWNEDHVYGVLVTPTQLVFYIDDRETHRENNAGRFNMPLYMMLSLGVGPDTWNNNVPRPGFSGGKMVVSYVRAYALAPNVR